MTNALVTSEGYNPFLDAGRDISDGVFLRFSGNDGTFTYGQDEEELAHHTQLAADVFNASWGWIFWYDGEVLDETMSMVREGPEPEEPDYVPEGAPEGLTLEDIEEANKRKKATEMSDGWAFQCKVNLRDMESGEEYIFKTSSGSGIRAFRALLKTYGKLYKFKGGKVPVVEISGKEFALKDNPKIKKWAPNLKIVDWRSEEELLEGLGENPGDYEDEQEEQARVALPPPADDDEEDETPASPSPSRRRGRARFA